MANVVGRPIAALVLSTDERAYLKRQVRGRRVARSLSERCRAILRCADGIPSKSVANELCIHERWFAELTRKQLRRGVHTSTKQLEADIRAFIARHNEKPKPYRWTKSADDILASVKRFCQKTQQTLCSEL
jgi:FixJ family two-component response regulator